MAFSNKSLPLLAVIIASFFWGASYPVGKIGLEYIPVFAFLAGRFLLVALFLLFFNSYKKYPLFEKFSYGLILGIVLSFTSVLQHIGIKHTTATNSGFITGVFVIFTPILYLIIYKQKLSFIKYISIGTALVGLWMITGGTSSINTGDLFVLGSAFMYSVYFICVDKFIKHFPNTLTLLFQQSLVIFIISTIIHIFHETQPILITPTSIFSIVFLSIFATLVAYGLQIYAQKKLNPVTVAIVLSSEAVFAAISAFFFLHEQFTPQIFMGATLIIAAIMIANDKIEKKILRKLSL